jgi:outer membrane protein TolC
MEKAAMDGRPEIQLAKNNVKTADLRHRFDENGVKPQLDAFATYAPTGNNYEADETRVIGHHLEPVDSNGDGTIDGTRSVPDLALRPLGFADSAKEVFNNDIYDWSIGLRFSIPIGNRAAKATSARSKIALEQSQLSLEDTERGVMVEVRTAVRAVETFKKSVDAARANVVLQRKKLEAEQKRYDNG